MNHPYQFQNNNFSSSVCIINVYPYIKSYSKLMHYRSLFFVFQAPAQYEFKYSVHDKYAGNDFGHQEKRHGHDAEGQYYVQLPDGRRQTVSYSVNKGTGYVANVHYEGKAQYPPPGKYIPHHGVVKSGGYEGNSLIHSQPSKLAVHIPTVHKDFDPYSREFATPTTIFH